MAIGAPATQATRSAPDWQSYPDLSLHPILAAALVEFHEHGYHGATVRGIATRAGLTMPSLYYHYGNKEGVLFALLEVGMDEMQAHLELSLGVTEDTMKKFENFISSMLLHYTHRREFAILHNESRFLGTELREQYAKRRALVKQMLENILRAGIAKGLMCDNDPDFTSRLLFAMLRGILDWHLQGKPVSAAEIGDRYIHSAVRLVSRNGTYSHVVPELAHEAGKRMGDALWS
jgi:TetR/AcrR family transcriptional regulator, cholesterol catabolism regulator